MSKLPVRVLLAQLFLAFANGQTKYCCTPVQWESVNYLTDARVTPGTAAPTYTEGTELTSMDGINHKIASLSTLRSGNLNITVQIIQLFDKNVQYTIESGECKQSPLGDWSQPCVPDNATLLKQTYYGLGNNKIDVDIYGIDMTPNTFYVTVARDDCTPVSVAGYGSQDDVSGMSLKSYTNVTLGIKDTSIFIVPDICNNATVTLSQVKGRHYPL